MNKRVAFHTLGCKVNQYDTEMVISQFRRKGYQIVDFDQEADVYVINTCTVTNIGDRKSRQMIRRATRQNPEAAVVVMGCFAQVSPDEVAEIPGVDLIVGTDKRSQVVELLEEKQGSEPVSTVADIFQVREFEELPAAEFTGRTRATLKIQDGCDQFCSYCRVPFARGHSRSRRPEKILHQVKEIVDQGYQEIVLTGVHLGGYGRDLPDQIGLADIVKQISAISGVRRVRISSVDPHEITGQLLQLIADDPKVCRHLHIPLQSGSDQILRSMRRRYDTGAYRQVVEKARAKVSGLAITTDVIVGFPGETERLFAETLSFVRQMQFSRLHVFKYSPRRQTPAAAFPGQVDSKTKEDRSRRLIELGHQLSLSFHQSFVGGRHQILIERIDEEGCGEGLTDNYVRTVVNSSHCTLEEGKLVWAKIIDADRFGIEGILD